MQSDNTSRAPSGSRDYLDMSTRDMATDVYSAFRGSGFSDAQSQALTAEINRENSLRPQYLFGTHLDPANNATNVGMLSWQGDRAPAALSFMRDRGVLDADGGIIPGREALQAQTDFIRQEMETDPSYARTREKFLGNPDIEPSEAARILGDNYIRWRRLDPEYASSGRDRIEEGYALLRGEGGLGSLDLDTFRPQSRPDTTGGVEAALRLLLEEDGGSEGRDQGVMSGLSMLESAFSTTSPRTAPIEATASVQRAAPSSSPRPLARFEGLASLGG